jgi:hypothetical protein
METEMEIILFKERIIMKEILGGELDQAFIDLNINAKKTYQAKDDTTDFGQVWELSDKDYEKICNIKEKDWKDNWGWWRGAEGSNMGSVSYRYNINHHYIIAWDGYHREENERENKKLPLGDRWIDERKYDSLLSYFCDEIGASNGKNVCALAIDLAEQNNMTMSELFNKFQE